MNAVPKLNFAKTKQYIRQQAQANPQATQTKTKNPVIAEELAEAVSEILENPDLIPSPLAPVLNLKAVNSISEQERLIQISNICDRIFRFPMPANNYRRTTEIDPALSDLAKALIIIVIKELISNSRQSSDLENYEQKMAMREKLGYFLRSMPEILIPYELSLMSEGFEHSTMNCQFANLRGAPLKPSQQETIINMINDRDGLSSGFYQFLYKSSSPIEDSHRTLRQRVLGVLEKMRTPTYMEPGTENAVARAHDTHLLDAASRLAPNTLDSAILSELLATVQNTDFNENIHTGEDEHLEHLVTTTSPLIRSIILVLANNTNEIKLEKQDIETLVKQASSETNLAYLLTGFLIKLAKARPDLKPLILRAALEAENDEEHNFNCLEIIKALSDKPKDAIEFFTKKMNDFHYVQKAHLQDDCTYLIKALDEEKFTIPFDISDSGPDPCNQKEFLDDSIRAQVHKDGVIDQLKDLAIKECNSDELKKRIIRLISFAAKSSNLISWDSEDSEQNMLDGTVERKSFQLISRRWIQGEPSEELKQKSIEAILEIASKSSPNVQSFACRIFRSLGTDAYKAIAARTDRGDAIAKCAETLLFKSGYLRSLIA